MRNNTIAQSSNCEDPLSLTHTVSSFPVLLMPVSSFEPLLVSLSHVFIMWLAYLCTYAFHPGIP